MRMPRWSPTWREIWSVIPMCSAAIMAMDTMREAAAVMGIMEKTAQIMAAASEIGGI